MKSRYHFSSNLENGVIFLPIRKEQVKVKLSPCIPGTHIGYTDTAGHTLTLTLLEGERSAACLSHFTARDRVHSIQ